MEAFDLPLAPPGLTTSRLVLEPLTDDERVAVEMVDVLSDAALYAHTGGEPPDAAELRARYARQARGLAPDGTELWFNWIIRASGTAIGFVQASVRRDAAEAQIAWLVGIRFQGQGYATEAAAAVLRWLESRSDVRRITAHIASDNVASQRVARRLGMAETREIEDGETVWESPRPVCNRDRRHPPL